jgi:coproporphyrinogen III oxidase
LNNKPIHDIYEFVKECGNSFVESYCPIVARRKKTKYTEEHVEFRKWRRSRYAEFNLVYDRGTKFGLHTPNANIENILMSLPLT